MHAFLTTRTPAGLGPPEAPGVLRGPAPRAATARHPAPATAAIPSGRPAPPAPQAGFFDELLGTAAPGLLGAASSVLTGDTAGALGQVRETAGAAVPGLVEHGAGALDGLVGGQAGGVLSSLGTPVGQGLGDVAAGRSTPGQAGEGLLAGASPALLSLVMSLLNR